MISAYPPVILAFGLVALYGTGYWNLLIVVTIVFMELRQRHMLNVAAAVAGVAWLGVLLWLASTDFTARAISPPAGLG